MYSDNWLKLGYKHGKRIKVSAEVDYGIWTDNENRVVGISVNFEVADDYHYELLIEEWMKFQTVVFKSTNLDEIKRLFEKFLYENSKMFDFQDALKLNGIKYKKAAFY